MSTQAHLDRERRRAWAQAGGRHDRLVRLLQLGLPAAVGALAAVMLLAPFGGHGEISFLVAKDSIDVAGQRLTVANAEYRGRDGQGRAFAISARNAVQRSATDPVVRMQGLAASIELADGPASITASTARYDPVHDTVMVDGQLDLRSAGGYQLQTGGVLVDLRRRTVRSDRAVTGATNIGRFSAGAISADLDSRTIRLSRGARLRIQQGL